MNPLVEPKMAPAAAPAVEPMNPQDANMGAPAAQAAPGGAEAAPSIPDEVLQIPAFQGLFAGEPAAISAPLSTFAKRPEAKVIQNALPALMQAGIGTYRSLAEDTAVLFNQFYLSGEELRAADEAGRLQEIAPPFDAVNQQISGMGKDGHPSLKERKVPGAFKQASANPPQSASPVSMPPPSSEKDIKAQQARMKNMQPGAPTSGPVPGAGRLLSNILKPVI
jgi:hypothetical protein